MTLILRAPYPLALPAEALLVTYGAATPGVWHLEPDGTATLLTGIPSVLQYGFNIVAKPQDPDRWLCLFHANTDAFIEISGGQVVSDGSSYSPLWLWDGSSFTEIPLTASGLPNGAYARYVEWSESTDDDWVVACGGQTTAAQKGGIWRGSGGSQNSFTASTGTSAATTPYLAQGTSDEVVIGATNNDRLWYLTSGGTYTLPSGSSPGELGLHNQYLDSLPGTRQILALTITGLLTKTADYHSATNSSTGVNVTGTSISIANGEAFIGARTGIGRVTDPFGTPSNSVVAASGIAVGYIRAARQFRDTRAVVGTLRADKAGYWSTRDGVVWVSHATPSTAIYDRIEVIDRGP